MNLGAHNPKKTKTLIVEDNANFRQTIKEILISKFPFMSINQAANKREALLKVANQQTDLIFMDIQLPGKSGLVLTKKIKKAYPHTIIIILTHHDLPEYQEAAIKTGHNIFFQRNQQIQMRLRNWSSLYSLALKGFRGSTHL